MRGLLIPLLFFVILILAVVIGASSSSDPDPGSENPPLPLTTKHETAILAAPDGTVYLVEVGSGKLLWSFSSGPSIYSSYQQIPNHEGEKLNAPADGDNFYIDCGEDWELYLHGTGLKKVKLPLSAEEFVKRTPFVSAGGGVMLGSKKTSVFVIDAKTGKVVRTFRSDNLPSAGERDAADETSIMTRADIEKWLPASSMDTEAVEKPLYVTRTDYALKYTSAKTGEVLWYLMFANIDASFQCEGIEDFLGGQRLDMKLSMPCQTRPVVYRIRDQSSLEPLFIANRVGDTLPGGGVLSLPATDHNELDNLLALYGSNGKELMLALPTPEREEFMVGSVPDNVAPQISGHVESDSIGHPQLWPSMLYSTLLPIAMAVFYCLRRAIGRRKSMLHKQPEEFKLQNTMPKKKKGRKPVVNRHSNHGGKRHAHNSQDGVVEIIKEDATARLLPPNPSDSNGTIGRKIGRLVVTNKEIAKGSNGTIVLEGHYEGRSVAVKRLVRTHHDVAVKEIQNLIASDQHPNIVRWYGVEYDQDFVYLCLERCTCSLFDLITFCTSLNQVTTSDLSRESLIRSNMRLLNNLGSNEELELWKANGHPSALLLKLMRDIVCGVAHLHELGIIHRDLKPQNVLVIKERSISAKISDMGISKHLDADMSSLSKHATGYGSSGWQAPEQLCNERQTRAVDLFSLGCMLFFCLTGGKHPFGESIERDVNIVNAQKDLFLIDHIPEATDLISQLLDPNPHLRPKAIEVMNHPLFWSSETKLSFLRDVSDRIELEDRENASELLEALENTGKSSLDGKWDEKMETTFINDIGRFRRYRYDSVRDLLRVVRNKLNHYRELSREIQAILGPVPEGFDHYFSTRFPKLLIEVYHVISSHCAGEEQFHKYFRSSGL